MHSAHRGPKRAREKREIQAVHPSRATASGAPAPARPASWTAGPSPTPSRGLGAPLAAAGLRQQADLARPAGPLPRPPWPLSWAE